MTEAKVRHLDLHRHATQFNPFMAPVELIGVTGVEGLQNEDGRRLCGGLASPLLHIAPHAVIAAGKSFTLHLFKQHLCGPALALWLLGIVGQPSEQAVLMRPKLRQRLRRARIGTRSPPHAAPS